jgi:hypothetical protein
MQKRESKIRHVQVEHPVTGRKTAAVELQGTVTKWKAWLGVLISILTIAGIVAGAARLGVQREVQDEIAAQAKPPNGPLFKMADACAEEHTEELARILRQELHTRITDTKDEVKDDIGENRAEIGKVQTRQEDMVRQLERMEGRLLDAIINGGD